MPKTGFFSRIQHRRNDGHRQERKRFSPEPFDPLFHAKREPNAVPEGSPAEKDVHFDLVRSQNLAHLLPLQSGGCFGRHSFEDRVFQCARKARNRALRRHHQRCTGLTRRIGHAWKRQDGTSGYGAPDGTGNGILRRRRRGSAPGLAPDARRRGFRLGWQRSAACL